MRTVEATRSGVPSNESDFGPAAVHAPGEAPIALEETIHATSEADLFAASPATTHTRTTVLPRRVQGEDGTTTPVVTERPRFDFVRRLGAGAVGTVELARDNDIRRTVAVKKLRTDARSSGALLRFADEVRIVGRLEHPSIVPIYDVGRDEHGDVYLVMKHLEGETMEAIIEKLRAGEPSYVARFTREFRAHLFLSVLDAMRYAHARGVLHRDLKPANLMIGPYGEVTVVDWGIAKPLREHAAIEPGPEVARVLDAHDARLIETQLGMLAGTPYYMSPEQAAGLNDALDERSDVYALSVVFYEWLTLEHPLEDAKTRTLYDLLGAVVTQDYDETALLRRAASLGVPCEYVYLVARGLRRDREERFASVGAMYDELKAILDGRIHVQCPVTLTKRATHVALRWVDRHPRLYGGAFTAGSLTLLAGLVSLVVQLARAL